MPIKSTLTNLVWFVGVLGALYTFYKTIGSKLLKMAYKHLMDEHNKALDKIDVSLKLIIENQARHSKELGVMAVAQKALFSENNIMWWRSSEFDGTTIEVGEKTAEFLKVDSSELLGTNWFNHVPQKEQKGLMEAYKESFTLKRDFNYEYTFIKGDGSKVRLNAYAKKPDYGDWFGILKAV